MDSYFVGHLIAIGALLLGSGFFSGAETALFSISRLSREALATRDDAGSKRVMWLLSNPRRLIVTLIVCNELINIFASSLVADLVQRQRPLLRETVQVAISTGLTVPLLLLFGEMTPKSLAVRVGERWARAVSWPLKQAMRLVTPLRWVLSAIA